MNLKDQKKFKTNYSATALKSWLKNTQGAEDLFSLLELDWPGAKYVSFGLADYITSTYPVMNGDAFLFEKCMQSGIFLYKHSLESKDDSYRFMAFVDGLARHIPEMLAYSVHKVQGDDKSPVWNPYLNGSLITWLDINLDDPTKEIKLKYVRRLNDKPNKDDFDRIRVIVLKNILTSRQLDFLDVDRMKFLSYL